MKGFSVEIKELITCSITHEIFLEPVRVDCSFLHCFEKEAIQNWCNIHSNSSRCPTCKGNISQIFKKDIYMANLVSNFLKENPHYQDEQYIPESKRFSAEIKELITCSITHEIFFEPVRVDCSFLHCFEKEAIQNWCKIHGNSSRCPACKGNISQIFIKDIYMANLVTSFLKENPHYQDEQYIPELSIERLFYYYKQKDTQTILQILRKNPHLINKPIEDGRSLLHHALLDENKEFTQALLELDGIDVNQRIENHPNRKHSNRTPLHIAAWANDPIFIKMLLEKGADPTLSTELGYTPLMDAVWEGKRENIEILLADPRTDINYKDNENNTILHDALIRCDEQIFQLLLHNKKLTILNDKNDYGRSPLFNAVSLTKIEQVRLLLMMPGIDIRTTWNFQGKIFTLLEEACDNFSIQVLLIDKLIESEYPFNSNEIIIIYEMLQKLNQKNKADFNQFLVRLSLIDFYQPLCIQLLKKLTPLIYHNKDYQLIVDFIKGYFILPDFFIENNKTFLQLMIEFKQNEIVKELLQITHININYQNTRSYTALHYAVIYNNYDAIALILQREDIQIDLKNNKYDTPFDIALKKGNFDSVQMLFPFYARNINFRQIANQPISLSIYNFLNCYQTILKLTKNVIPSAQQIMQLMQLTKNSRHAILEALKMQSHPKYDQIKYLLSQIHRYQKYKKVELKIDDFFKNIDDKNIIEQLNQLFLISHAYNEKDSHWQTEVRSQAYSFFNQSLKNLDPSEKYRRLMWAKKQTIFAFPTSTSLISKVRKSPCEMDIDQEIQNVRKLNK